MLRSDLYTNCISKINNVLIDNAEDLDAAMSMSNLLEYSKNYKKTTGSLWNYYRDKPSHFSANNYNANSITNSESFNYESSITGKNSSENQENGENAEQENTKTKTNLKIFVSSKHLCNFWRTLNMSLINCEVSLALTWFENCVFTDITTKVAVDAQGNNPARTEINSPTNATFKKADIKLYVPVVTLSTQDNNKLLEQLRTRFKRKLLSTKCSNKRLQCVN